MKQPKMQRNPEVKFLLWCDRHRVEPTVRQHGKWMRVRVEEEEREQLERARNAFDELKRVQYAIVRSNEIAKRKR